MTLETEWIIPLGLGLVFIIAYFVKSYSVDNLLKNGVEVEGVIFDVEWESTESTFSSSNAQASYPVVRFVTNEGTWITKKSNQSGILIKQGQKIKLKYNPENPENFIITSGQFKWTSYIFLVAGFVSFGFGVYKLLDHVSV